jgi:hypothetical protein
MTGQQQSRTSGPEKRAIQLAVPRSKVRWTWIWIFYFYSPRRQWRRDL